MSLDYNYTNFFLYHILLSWKQQHWQGQKFLLQCGLNDMATYIKWFTNFVVVYVFVDQIYLCTIRYFENFYLSQNAAKVKSLSKNAPKISTALNQAVWKQGISKQQNSQCFLCNFFLTQYGYLRRNGVKEKWGCESYFN